MRARLSEGSLFEKSSAKTFLLSPTALAVRQEPNPLGVELRPRVWMLSFVPSRAFVRFIPPADRIRREHKCSHTSLTSLPQFFKGGFLCSLHNLPSVFQLCCVVARA